jgi:hypothetical protein
MNFGQAVGLFLEVVGVTFLTGLAIKSECDRHKAVVKLHTKEMELVIKEIEEVFLKAENKHLKEQLEKCKKQNQEEA